MKRIKSFLTTTLVVAIMIASTTVYAEENYVRITQPIVKEDAKEDLQTFEAQINIMGEATIGTEIKIQVYYGDVLEEEGKCEVVLLEELKETIETDEYILKAVGATGTFNQLITLKEGDNNILLQYQFKGEKEEGVIVIRIYRKSEMEKEIIKGLISPQIIAEKMLAPALPVGYSVSVQQAPMSVNK